jgi:hypothetical protein
MSWLKASRDPLPEPPSRTNRWLILVGAVSLAAIGIGLLVLMTQATGNRERYNQNFEWLVLINTVVASGLLITILWGMVRLLRIPRQSQSQDSLQTSRPEGTPPCPETVRQVSCQWLQFPDVLKSLWKGPPHIYFPSGQLRVPRLSDAHFRHRLPTDWILRLSRF